jgi:ABC-2 type transport system permease protein
MTAGATLNRSGAGRGATAYWAIASTRFRALLQYRGAAVAGIFTQIFFGLVHVMILAAFYSTSAQTPSLRLEQAVGYVWLAQGTLAMFPWNVDRSVRDLIREGTVVYELCRPLDLYAVWFSRALALRTAPLVLRILPMLAFAMLLLPAVGLPEWRLRPPPSAAAGALWVAAMLGALLLSCALTVLMNISMLWTITDQGVARFMGAIIPLFAGLLVPLPLLPDWAQPVLRALPFAGTLDLPVRVFTGHIPATRAGLVVLHQLVWTGILVLLGRFLLARGTRRLVVQGG